MRAAEGHVHIDEVTLSAGDGTFRASGEITGLAPGGDKPVARLSWKAERFRAFNRPNLHLVVGGEGSAVAQGGKITLSGKLAADEGAIVYVATPDATLGDDVVVKGWTRPEKRALRFDDIPLLVDLSFDLGDHLTFSGEGIETRLAGAVRVTTGPYGLVGKGSIRTVRGTYFAFGQRLDIDRGQLVFDGPLDNPGLDIVALRKNLAVEAGVAVTGTVKVPVIQLTSNPPVPDSEKLSWLVLGQAGSDRSTGADLAALQAASAALLGAHGKPVSASVAQSIGLDDISLKSSTRSAQPGAPAAETQVIAVGKRLTDRLTLVYEQGLTHCEPGVAARIRAHALAHAARRGRNVRRPRCLFPPHFRLTRQAADGATGDNVAKGLPMEDGDVDFDHELDTRGLSCPLPILKTKKSLNDLTSGQVLKIVATDPGSVKDMQAFAKQTGHALLSSNEENKTFVFYMRKK